MEGTTHRGGYYLLYPDAPQALSLLDEGMCMMLQSARRLMRQAVQQVFGMYKDRTWVAGSLLSRAIAPAPQDHLDKAPMHDYSRVHVDRFNLHQYEWSALLYLSECGVDFHGGEFEFVDAKLMPGGTDGSDELVQGGTLTTQEELDAFIDARYPDGTLPEVSLTSVAPKRGRLLLFSAGSENPHRVKRVTSGRRHLLSVWLTSDPRYGMHD